MPAVYNEFDPYAADWLAALAAKNLIAPGAVDARSIEDVSAKDVGAATQFHAFAGIGVWSYALRLAGWPDDLPVWTGSCPCQPFSIAGIKKGTSDARHLWPVWFSLIQQRRPPIIFGEQVASPDGLKWLDSVSTDLEKAGYAFGAADLCAAGVGAPHIRQRLYFVAVADTDDTGPQGRLVRRLRSAQRPAGAGRVVDAPVADTDGLAGGQGGEVFGRGDSGGGTQPRTGFGGRGGAGSAWSDGVEWLECRDGFQRPTQSGILPLVDGAPSRVGRIRAYGNAIVPQVAATFVASVVDVLIGVD
jgi:DNA (cytosine-5)-methyltransferase 1